MKRCEVTRHLMHSDFPGQHCYTESYRVCPPSGSTPVRGCMGAMPGQFIQPLLFSASMIAHALADDEHLPRVCIVQNEMHEDSEIGLLWRRISFFSRANTVSLTEKRKGKSS